MKIIYRIALAELQSLFYSPVAWLILIVFTIQCSFAFTGVVDANVVRKAMGYGVGNLTLDIYAGMHGFFKTLQEYLYEPNSSILKAGAFKSIAQSFGIDKLAVSSHLYTSRKYVSDFPGRAFEILEAYPFSNVPVNILRPMSRPAIFRLRPMRYGDLAE